MYIQDDTEPLGRGLVNRTLQALQFILIERLVGLRLQALPAKRQANNISALGGAIGEFRVLGVGVILEDHPRQPLRIEFSAGNIHAGEARGTQAGGGMGCRYREQYEQRQGESKVDKGFHVGRPPNLSYNSR